MTRFWRDMARPRHFPVRCLPSRPIWEIVVRPEPNGLAGAALGLVGIFLPEILILIGTLPFWDAFRVRPPPGGDARRQCGGGRFVGRRALRSGVDTSVRTPADFAVALVGFVLLVIWRAPPLLVVAVSAIGGIALAWGSL